MSRKQAKLRVQFVGNMLPLGRHIRNARVRQMTHCLSGAPLRRNSAPLDAYVHQYTNKDFGDEKAKITYWLGSKPVGESASA